MTGIISYGAYIPLYRLNREAIIKAWGEPHSPGRDRLPTSMKTVSPWE